MCFRPANLVLTKTCPECGERFDATNAKCIECGYNMVNVEPDMPNVNAPGMPGADVADPSSIGKPPSAPKAPVVPDAPVAPKAPRQ